MRNEPRVWPEVGDAGTSGAGAVPLRSAQMMGQQKKKKKKKRVMFQVHRTKYFKHPVKLFHQKQTQSVVLLFCYHAATTRYPCACHSVVKTSLFEGEHGVFN